MKQSFKRRFFLPCRLPGKFPGELLLFTNGSRQTADRRPDRDAGRKGALSSERSVLR